MHHGCRSRRRVVAAAAAAKVKEIPAYSTTDKSILEELAIVFLSHKSKRLVMHTSCLLKIPS